MRQQKRLLSSLAENGEMLDLTLVEVWWVDSTSISSWSEPTDLRNHSMACRTIGFLCDTTDDRVVVSSTVDSNGCVMDPVAIPTSAIVEFYEVTLGHTRRGYRT